MADLNTSRHIPQVGNLILLGSLAIVLYVLGSFIATKSRHRRIQAEKGTGKPFRIPTYDPILGLDLFRGNLKAVNEHRFLQRGLDRFEEFNVNTIAVNVLGTKAYFTREPEILKTIQATDHKIWSLGAQRIWGFRPLLGVGIFTSDGAEWSHSREMIRPNFVRSQVADLSMFESHIQDMIALIPKDGSTIDLSELFFLLTMDSATDFLFGQSTGALTRGTADGFADAFNRGQMVIANRARWGSFYHIFRYLTDESTWDKDRKFIHDFVDAYVKTGLAKRNQLLAEKQSGEGADARYTFIDELVRQTSDPVRIRSELLNVLLAGRDTTASLLSNAWFVLAKRPDIWMKLQEEVDTLNGQQPSFEQIKNMTYLKAFLNESLRLHPVVPINSREALEDTTVPVGGGPDGQSPLFVPKGHVVTWSVYAMHRRKDYYGEDAEEFKPERWIDDVTTGKKALRVGWNYLPFNGGARICLGQQFALTEASYTTVRLLQTFSGIESRDAEPWKENLALTCTSLNGTKVSLTPR